jgi:O-antigen ligase
MMVCSILWTMSRSGIAGTGVALAILTFVLAYRSRGRAQTVWAVGLVLFATAGLVAWRGTDTLVGWYGNTSTLEWRFQLWNDTLPALRDFWLTGSGFNTYGTVMLLYPRTDLTVFPKEAHSDYLQLAVEGGLLVGIPVLLLIVAVAREAVRRLRQPQDEMTWWIRMGAVAGICGMAVQELTEFSLQIPGVALMFATCVAIAIHEPAPIALEKRRREVQAKPRLVTSL